MESLLLGESASHEIKRYLRGGGGGEYTYVNTRESTVGSSTWFVAHSVCTCVIRNGVNAKPTSFIEAHYLQTEEKAVLVFSF